eukprot:SAG22_NODE_6399_length_861_cov_1.177165_1_plen_81_part_00
MGRGSALREAAAGNFDAPLASAETFSMIDSAWAAGEPTVSSAPPHSPAARPWVEQPAQRAKSTPVQGVRHKTNHTHDTQN